MVNPVWISWNIFLLWGSSITVTCVVMEGWGCVHIRHRYLMCLLNLGHDPGLVQYPVYKEGLYAPFSFLEQLTTFQ